MEKDKKQKIGIVGAGAWGTAMAALQACNGHTVTIWGYEKETVDSINRYRCNEVFLPHVTLPDNLSATQDLSQLVRSHSILVMAIPSHVTRNIIEQIVKDVDSEHRVVILTKGMEQHSLCLMSDVYQDAFDSNPVIAVLSGPNFALEVGKGMPTAATLACANERIGRELQQILSTSTFRLYHTSDMVGVQIGGTIKNVIAIAAGICDGMMLGLNARAALICRGLAEMKRMGTLLGGTIETFLGLSGVGDLILTATGDLSRNYTLGVALGKGVCLDQYLSQKNSVAEGVKNAVSLHELAAKHGLEMPICEAVYDILYSDLACKDAVFRLLERDLPICE
ncbi:MAG: NAD(P)-dependent glycerol-3-phosphate dehydrogenase [SAR324 cluster bacterium]|nr:NAD(P)-dependent glycerol-3-phosphate dehydrogenase [SAR324 cluster bacterium]